MAMQGWVDINDLDDPSSPYAEAAVAMASHVLWALSGQKYSGVHNIQELYCCSCFSAPAMQQQLIQPYLTEGKIYNCSCSPCNEQARLRLRGQPVVAVQLVQVDGAALDYYSYDLVDHAIVRLPAGIGLCGRQFEVGYIWGVQPPAAGQVAATSLANQLVLGAAGSSACRLPERISSVSRQGVSWTIVDPQEFLSQGRTGLYEVDLFLSTVNPNHAQKRPRVFSPDLPRAEVIV